MKFSALSRAGRKEKQKIIRLYPTNTNLAIDLFRFARGDKIDIEEFTECVKQVPYFSYPAFRLQEQMREYFGGFALWANSKAKIEEEEKEQKVKKLKDQFLKRKQDREREIYEKLLATYELKIAAYNKQYYKK